MTPALGLTRYTWNTHNIGKCIMNIGNYFSMIRNIHKWFLSIHEQFFNIHNSCSSICNIFSIFIIRGIYEYWKKNYEYWKWFTDIEKWTKNIEISFINIGKWSWISKVPKYFFKIHNYSSILKRFWTL